VGINQNSFFVLNVVLRRFDGSDTLRFDILDGFVLGDSVFTLDGLAMLPFFSVMLLDRILEYRSVVALFFLMYIMVLYSSCSCRVRSLVSFQKTKL